MNNQQSAGLAEPPDGAVVGESVPRENEITDMEKSIVSELVGIMKSKGEPFVSMSDKELREKAVEKLQDRGVIR